MPNTEPVISIIIPCYNQVRFLKDAVAGLKLQDFTNYEVIIVDDGSTEDVSAIVSQWPWIKLICQANAGVSSARNTGLSQARGEFVIFLDADDWFEPGFLTKQTEAAARIPQGDFFYGSCRWLEVDGRTTTRVANTLLEANPYQRLLLGNTIPIHTVMMRRNKLIEIGGFNSTIRCGEDWEVFLRLARVGNRFVAVPDAWVVYRRHLSSASYNFRMMISDGFRVRELQSDYQPNSLKHRWDLMRCGRNIRYNAVIGAFLPALLCRIRARALGEAVRMLIAESIYSPWICWYLFVEFPLVSLLGLLTNGWRGILRRMREIL